MAEASRAWVWLVAMAEAFEAALEAALAHADAGKGLALVEVTVGPE